MNHLRQLDIIDPQLLALPIHIIGCGSVGSWTALTLAKVGASQLVLWDPDVVEAHNVPNQVYRPDDVGRPKVEALADLIELFTGYVPRIHHRACDGLVDSGVVVLAVDSMTARIDLWRALRDRPIDWVVDSRMGAEVARILTVRPCSPGSKREYARTLYTSAQALREPCTARSTAYCATGLASFITAKIVKLVSGRPFSPDLNIDFHNAVVFNANQLAA